MKMKSIFLISIFTITALICGPNPTPKPSEHTALSPLLENSSFTNDSIRTNPGQPYNPLTTLNPSTPAHTIIVPTTSLSQTWLLQHIERNKEHKKQSLRESCRRLALCAVPTMMLGTLITILIRTGALSFLN